MQVMYQTQDDVTKPNNLAPTMGAGFNGLSPTGVRRYPQKVAETTSVGNEVYGHKLIYSPYLAPSHLIVEQKANQANLAPIYMQNIARTKYASISQVQKPSDTKALSVFT